LYTHLAVLNSSNSDVSSITGAQVWENAVKGVASRSLRVHFRKDAGGSQRCSESRTETYAHQGALLGLKQRLDCETKNLVFVAEDPLNPSLVDVWTDSGKRVLKCIKERDGKLVIEWGSVESKSLEVHTEADRRYVEIPSGPKFYLDSTETGALEEGLQNIGAREDLMLTNDSVGIVRTTSPAKRRALGEVLKKTEALATSLFDSDVAQLITLGLDAREALGVFVPDVPETYTLLARCILVFHGMLIDVIKENVLRLLPITYAQWLAESHRDRFFTHWAKPATEYLDANSDSCPWSDRVE
jgi:hypothetical protein